MTVQRPHILLPVDGRRLDYQMRGAGGKTTQPPRVPNRAAVADRVIREVRAVADLAVTAAMEELDPARIPLTMRASNDWGLAASVPGRRRNEVLSANGFGKMARVNVALDPETLESFEKAGARYRQWNDNETRRKPNNFNYFEANPRIAMTTVEDLWVSHVAIPEGDTEIRWEVWLQPADEPRFREVLDIVDLRASRAVKFEDARVIAIDATRAQFDRLARSAAIAQLRPASNLNAGLMQVPSGVQAAAVTAAASRIVAAPADAPAVCLLDTGIWRDHPLLTGSVGTVGSVVAGDGADFDGHGTKMAGLALFEDLAPAIVGRENIRLSIGLESVAIEGPPGAGGARLPAERLRRAVDLVESQQERSRTFCLAMNAPDEAHDGGASSLSSELDLLAADVANQRLFCVAAGNLDGLPVFGDYQARNDVTAMMSPSQAWNALSIGACTDLVDVPATHAPVAPGGDLSPWSRTAVNWDRRLRPAAKPDVVFEGGNQMIDVASNMVGQHADLCVLTTSQDPVAPLTLTGQTSAATAAIAGLCANLQAEYSMLWPETIRGLVIHSCEHSPAMVKRADAAAQMGGTPAQALLDRFGYGRPDRGRARENAEDALTLINQGALRPLRLNEKATDAILGQMRVHRLPWPPEVLEALGEHVDAELRVTLSYFIEPNPGAVIKGNVDQYPSHGFDFDIIRPDESEDQAIARNNELHTVPIRSSAPAPAWRFGKMRGRGSVRHDRLRLPAADLARVGGVLVFPRKGWWGRDLKRTDQQARYALIVTIRTPGEEIYTEITTAITIDI